MSNSPLDLSHVAVHRLVTGMTGKGKSTLVRSLVAKDRAPWKFAFETYKHEYSSAPPHGLGWARCIDRPTLLNTLIAGKPSAFDSAPLFPGDRVDAFTFWIRWVYQMGRTLPGRKLVIIEEIEATSEHQQSPLAPAFKEMLDEGRGFQFDVVMVAQRASTVNVQVRANTTEIYAFQQVDEDQLDWLRYFRFDPVAVETLQRGQWIWRNRETGEVRTNVRTRPTQPARAGSPGKAR